MKIIVIKKLPNVKDASKIVKYKLILKIKIYLIFNN